MGAKPCCCGRKQLEGDEPVIVGDYQHEPVGYGRFCGTVKDHDLRDLRAEVERLTRLRERMLDEGKWHRAYREMVSPDGQLGKAQARAKAAEAENAFLRAFIGTRGLGVRKLPDGELQIAPEFGSPVYPKPSGEGEHGRDR